MKDMRAVRFNEKIKRLSTLVGGGGLAFAITALTRWLDSGPDLWTWVWILTGVGLTFLAVQMNELLQPEDEL